MFHVGIYDLYSKTIKSNKEVKYSTKFTGGCYTWNRHRFCAKKRMKDAEAD